jgi:hypothetical protein
MDARQYKAISPSSRRALGYAHAAALLRRRAPDAFVEAEDLLVGLLLAHPDRDGEARVLLTHFGLTGRDLLPRDYPPLTVDDLRSRTRLVPPDDPPPLSPQVERILTSLPERAAHLRHLLGALLKPGARSVLHIALRERLATAGSDPSTLSRLYDNWLSTDATGGKRAGESLRAMLEQELPRRPIDVPTYAADRVGKGDDLIGIRREVDAFAYLLASKAQRPPLAVGLFGDWGSGKSFFMRAVEDRVTAIERQIADRPQTEVPFWKRIKQIEFNAWEYVQGSLWASLLDHIFNALGNEHIDLVKSRRGKIVAAQNDAALRAESQATERERLAGEVQERENAVERAESERQAELEELRTKNTAALAAQLDKASRDVWAGASAELAGRDAAELARAVGEARAELLRGRGLLGAYWTVRRVILATLAALLVPGIALAADALELPPAVSVLGALSALVPAVTTLLRSATHWTREQLNALDAVARMLEAQLAERERELDEQVATARDALQQARLDLAAAQSSEQAALDEATRLAEQLVAMTPGRVLGEFLQERSRSDDYRRHLGLMARVRDDLANLEDLVRRHNDAGTEPTENSPPNRIILYIDDLDRCSSDKVVEVLEAVHLLLAFELFVVVVAVDSRWLSFALTDELRALDSATRSGRRATPHEYLEKIFQLPFWVQPLSEPGRRSLLHGLLEGSVSAASGNGAVDGNNSGNLSVGPREEELLATMLSRRGSDPRLDAHALALTADDLRFMESLAPLLGDTPRRVKRFVNVTQLLLALPPSLENDTQSPPDRSIVAFLAAVNSGLPGLAPAFFDVIAPGSSASLLDTVLTLTGVPADEQKQLVDWLKAQPAWASLPLGRLDTRLDTVRRLSFQRAPGLLAHATPLAPV